MTINSEKRKTLFDKFSANLNLLLREGLLRNLVKKYEDTYICPICLVHFSQADLDLKVKNFLTLEDVPPVSLGGKSNMLTCRDCNNTCGRTIDKHLSLRMKEMDKEQIVPGAIIEGWFTRNGVKAKGMFTVNKNGTTNARFDKKYNNPTIFEQFNQNPTHSMRFEPLPRKSDPKQVQFALLKTAYLLVFAKFGYAFILDPAYDRVREQLKNPNKDIYPTNFWFNHEDLNEIKGIPFIIEKGLQSIMPTFSLSTHLSKRVFYAIIPLTTKPIEDVINELQDRFHKTEEFDIDMYPFPPHIDYLTDIDAINYALDWINRVK